VDLISKKLQLKLQVVPVSWREGLEMAKDKQIDFFPCLSQTPEREEYLKFTDRHYLSFPLVIITRKGLSIGSVEDLSGKKVAVDKNLVAYSKLKSEYSHLNIQFVYRTTTPNVMKAVYLGEADASFVSSAVAGYLISQGGWSNLKIAAETDWNKEKLKMAVRKDWPVFASIIDKTLQTISKSEKEKIILKWSPVRFEHGVDLTFVAQQNLPLITSVGFIFVISLIFLILLYNKNRKLLKVNAEREKLMIELREAFEQVKQLKGLIPICASCKKIRDDKGYWNQIESYIEKHSDAQFSHGICDECAEELYSKSKWYQKRKREKDK
jgi:hypothetical protein